MCRHIYYWNVVAFDGKQPISLTLGLGVRLEMKGSLFRYPAETYIFIFNFSLVPFLTDRRSPSASSELHKAKIHAAVNAGNLEETKRLLSTSTLDLRHEGVFLKKLFVSAIDSDSLLILKYTSDKFRELLQCEYETSIDGDKHNCSLLHYAAAAGSKEIVEFLVQSGLDVKQRTSEQEITVLGFAASKAHLHVVDYLLNINSTEDILSLGADPIVMAGEGGSVEIFNKLVNIGFDPMEKDKYGYTSLHLALKTGEEELAFYIMKQYPQSMHMTGKNDRSALHYAAFGGSVSLLKHLIDNGLDTRHVDKHGSTILHVACWAGKKDIVRYLTQDYEFIYLLRIEDNDGRTALDLASEDIVELFSIMSSWQCNFGIVDIAMRTMYTRYRINIVHIDVLSCLHRWHHDVNDVYTISWRHNIRTSFRTTFQLRWTT